MQLTKYSTAIRMNSGSSAQKNMWLQLKSPKANDEQGKNKSKKNPYESNHDVKTAEKKKWKSTFLFNNKN